MAKDRRSRDQKRKAKLAKKNRKDRLTSSLAYRGTKYKTDELAYFWMCTETGIYEASVISGRMLRDESVANAIEKLIAQLRSRSFCMPAEEFEISYEIGQEEDLVIECILQGWSRHYDETSRISKHTIVGVLRSILGTIELTRANASNSQRYIHYICNFLTNKLGVSVQRVPVDSKDPMEYSR